MTHHPSRLEAINGSTRRPGLATRIERADLSKRAADVLLPLAVQTDPRGVCWYTLRRLAAMCKTSEETCRRGIVEASEHAALLWYIAPERRRGHTPRPLPFASDAPADAWGFILPDAATDKAGLARFVVEHLAHDRDFPLKGEGCAEFMARWGRAGNDATSSEPSRLTLPRAAGDE